MLTPSLLTPWCPALGYPLCLCGASILLSSRLPGRIAGQRSAGGSQWRSWCCLRRPATAGGWAAGCVSSPSSQLVLWRFKTWDPGRQTGLEIALPRRNADPGPSTRRVQTEPELGHAGLYGLRDGRTSRGSVGNGGAAGECRVLLCEVVGLTCMASAKFGLALATFNDGSLASTLPSTIPYYMRNQCRSVSISRYRGSRQVVSAAPEQPFQTIKYLP